MRMAAAALALLLSASPLAAGAQTYDAQAYDAQAYDERPVTHGPFQPEVKDTVREFVLRLASSFGDFYPDAQFRNVRAVYFPSGAIIVCGEMNKMTEDGPRSGWRYFSNSGPLIFESDHLETLCDQRTYAQQAFSDDTEYGPDFTHAAVSGLKTQTAEEHP